MPKPRTAMTTLTRWVLAHKAIVVTVWIAHHMPSQTLSNVPGSTRRSTTPKTTTPIAQATTITYAA